MKKQSVDVVFLFVALSLCAIGLVAVFSASTQIAKTLTGNEYYFFFKQIILFFIGLFVMLFLSKIDIEVIRSLSKFILLVSIILLVVVLIIGKEVKGGSRWISFSGLNIHPASLAQVSVIIYLADYFTRKQQDLNDFKRLIPILVIVGAICLLIVAQPDFSTAAMLGFTVLLMLIIAEVKFKYITIIVLSGVGFLTPLLFFEGYRINRIKGWLNGAGTSQLGINYQSDQSLLSFGVGGISGVGIGQSKQKFFFLPESHTDYIFAIIGEEIGFLGTSLIVICFLILIWRGFKIAKRSVDPFLYFLASGLVCYIGIYAFINALVVLNVLPTTGLPMPFLSYGGSFLILCMGCVGLILNISKQLKPERI